MHLVSISFCDAFLKPQNLVWEAPNQCLPSKADRKNTILVRCMEICVRSSCATHKIETVSQRVRFLFFCPAPGLHNCATQNSITHLINFVTQHCHTQSLSHATCNTHFLTHHVLYRSVFHRVLSFFLIYPAHFHACFVLIVHGCLAFDCVSCPACTNRTG